MSSPPNLSLSPPYPVNLALPKKRPAGPPSSSSGAKRRKPSTSSSSHPLRQTSFPPQENFPSLSGAPSAARTVDDSASGVGAISVTGTSSVGGHGRKGRKIAADARSNTVVSATGTGALGGTADATRTLSGINGVAGREDYEGDEDDGDGDGFDDAVMEEVKEDEAAQKMAAEHMAMLVNAFNHDQTERYNVWRRIKLKKETVRRITNQTLSQSVSQPVIVVINGYTKSFIGELVERARDVQTEWLAASSILPLGEATAARSVYEAQTGPASNNLVNKTQTSRQSTIMGHKEYQRLEKQHGMIEEGDRGPLTPDHLREALRRYKKDREGGNAGFQGLSLHGRESVAARAGGKRLFR